MRTEKEMSTGGLQSRPGRQQLPCRAGSFPIRVSESQEEQAIIYRDSKEFITHVQAQAKSGVPFLFPGGKNRGAAY